MRVETTGDSPSRWKMLLVWLSFSMPGLRHKDYIKFHSLSSTRINHLVTITHTIIIIFLNTKSDIFRSIHLGHNLIRENIAEQSIKVQHTISFKYLQTLSTWRKVVLNAYVCLRVMCLASFVLLTKHYRTVINKTHSNWFWGRICAYLISC